jgi:hypothetical protein
MGGTEDLGRRIGIVNTIIGLGALCGPPLAGLLNDTSLRYAAVGYFGGEFKSRPRFSSAINGNG